MLVYDDRPFGERIKIEFLRKRDEVKWGTKRLLKWISEHPQEFIGICTISLTAIGAASKGVRGLMREIDIQHEKYDEKCRVWDPVNGVQWYTKRPLNATQKLEFERRVAEGESRGTILQSMNVLNRRK